MRCEPSRWVFTNSAKNLIQNEAGMDTYDFESIYWPTDATERPQIRINATDMNNYLYSTQTDAERLGSRTPTGQFLMPGTPVDARWASGDSSGNPKIVSSFQGPNDPPMVRGNLGSAALQPLNLEIDPNAWELKSHERHRLFGGDCEYRRKQFR